MKKAIELSMDIRWRLRNIKTGDIVDISKSIFKVGRDSKADIKSTLAGLSRQQATFSILVDGGLYIVDCKVSNQLPYQQNIYFHHP